MEIGVDYELIEYGRYKSTNGTFNAYNIKALKDIKVYSENRNSLMKIIKAGTIGGFVDSEDVLKDCIGGWIEEDAVVCDGAKISYGYVREFTTISGNVIVKGTVGSNAEIRGGNKSKPLVMRTYDTIGDVVIVGSDMSIGGFLDAKLGTIKISGSGIYIANGIRIKPYNNKVISIDGSNLNLSCDIIARERSIKLNCESVVIPDGIKLSNTCIDGDFSRRSIIFKNKAWSSGRYANLDICLNDDGEVEMIDIKTGENVYKLFLR